MPADIEAVQRSVGQLFSDEYRFVIPRFQRPYSWDKDQAVLMLDDLLEAARGEEPIDDLEPYFLGAIVIIKGQMAADAVVVDGQQRLTTLTLLLSVARLCVPPPLVDSLNARLHQSEDVLAGNAKGPRLTVRDRDRQFFEREFQSSEPPAALPTMGTDALPDSQATMVGNAVGLLDRLRELPTVQCERLLEFLYRRTLVVVVSSHDLDSAFTIFNTINQRGLSLSRADILKSEIIGALAPNDQDEYSRRWEDAEDSLGRPVFDDLFGHVRNLYPGAQRRRSILTDFREGVLLKFPNRRIFVDDILLPYARALGAITKQTYPGGADSESVNAYLRWLDRLPNSDWVPLAMRFLRQPEVDGQAALPFLVALERLASSLLIRRVDDRARQARYRRLSLQVDRGMDITAAGSELHLQPSEQAATLDRLARDIELHAISLRYVLLRIEAELTRTLGPVYPKEPAPSIEHVLPRNPPPNSDWTRKFTDDERRLWQKRLANVVLVPDGMNKEAGNRSFWTKKKIYFDGEVVAPFALTNELRSLPAWTPKVLERRQERLLGVVARLWQLERRDSAGPSGEQSGP